MKVWPARTSSPELVPAVGQVLAAEYPEFEHLLRSKFGPECRIEAAAGRRHQSIAIAALHPVVDGNDTAHSLSLERFLHANQCPRRSKTL